MSVQCRSCGQGLALLDDVCLYFNDDKGLDVVIKPERKDKLFERDGTVVLFDMDLKCPKCNNKVGKMGKNSALSKTFPGQVFAFSGKDALVPGQPPTPKKWIAHEDLLRLQIVVRTDSTFLTGVEGPGEEEDDENNPDLVWPAPERVVRVQPDEIDLLCSNDLTVKVPPRDYQAELIAVALLHPTIVYLPTGSGKTLVAACVIKRMLELNPTKLAFFVVPTVPLVSQQADALRELCGLSTYQISGMDGNRLQNRGPANVIVITDGSLMSCLKRTDPLSTTRFSLSHVCVLAFDEAHHAVKDRQMYTRIMVEKFDLVPPEFRPHILGLTATPPKDTAAFCKTMGNAILYSPHVFVDSLVSRHTNPTKCEPVSFVSLEEEDRFVQCLNNHLHQLHTALQATMERKLLDAFAKLDNTSKDLPVQLRGNFADENSSSTQAEIAKHLAKLFNLHDACLTEGVSETVQRYLQHNRCRVHFTSEKLEELIADLCVNLAPFGANVKSVASDNFSARLLKLVDIIEDCCFGDDYASSRAVIFVRTRELARRMADLLARHPSIQRLRPTSFIGQRGCYGMNWQDQQRPVLEKFRKGTIKLLISTPVLHEGFDLPSIKLVVHFESPRDVRSLVQSRGRARDFNSKVNVLVNCESDEHRHFQELERDEKELYQRCKDYAKKNQHQVRLSKNQLEYIAQQSTAPSELQRQRQSATTQNDDLSSEEDDNTGDGSAGAVRIVGLPPKIDTTREMVHALRKAVSNLVDVASFEWTTGLVQMGPQHDGHPDWYDEFLSAAGDDVFRAGESELWLHRQPKATGNSDDEGLPALPQVVVGVSRGYLEPLPSRRKFVSLWTCDPRSPDGSRPTNDLLVTGDGSTLAPTGRIEWSFIVPSNAEGENNINLELNWVCCGPDGDDEITWLIPHHSLDRAVLLDHPPNNNDNLLPSVVFTLLHPPIVKKASLDQRQVQRLMAPHGLMPWTLRLHLDFAGSEGGRFFAQIRSVLSKTGCFDVYDTRLETLASPVPVEAVLKSRLPVVPPNDLPQETILQLQAYWSRGSAFLPLLVPEDVVDYLQSLNAELSEAAHLLDDALARPSPFVNLLHLLRSAGVNRTLRADTPRQQDYARVHSIVITPSRVVALESQLVATNSVLRHFLPNDEHQPQNKFVIVRFRDDDMELRDLSQCSFFLAQIRDTFLSKECSFPGFDNSDEFYFVGSSNGQRNEAQAWFSTLKPEAIREFVGAFDQSEFYTNAPRSLKAASKLLKRIGQAFSTSYETVTIGDDQLTVEQDITCGNDDIKFTDGAGRIRRSVADRVLALMPNRPASSTGSVDAFQIRKGGAKGVLLVVPDADLPTDVVLSKSMSKFKSQQSVLNVLSYSRPIPLYLNIQVIVIMESLGERILDALLALQQQQLDRLRLQLENPVIVRRAVSSNMPGIDLDALNQSGFMLLDEPFIRGLVHAYYSAAVESLAVKAHIEVPKGRVLMGVPDFTGTLEYGEIFCWPSDVSPKEQAEIEGSGCVMVYRSPALHPGDIRLLRPRPRASLPENSSLARLRDVVVFPTKGPRSHADECAGGDLDGDLYSVVWEPSLLQCLNKELVRSHGHKPYDPTTVEQLKDKAQQPIDKIAQPIAYAGVDLQLRHSLACAFVANLMSRSQLGRLANTHKAHADRPGVLEESSVDLAHCHHAQVDTHGLVDFPSSASSASTDYPDFLRRDPSYTSEKANGALFRVAHDFADVLAHDQGNGDDDDDDDDNDVSGMDPHLVLDGHEAYLDWAGGLYREYCSQVHSLLTAYNISNESQLIMQKITDDKLAWRDFRVRQVENAHVCWTLVFDRIRGRILEEASADNRLLRASALYVAAYQKGQEHQQQLPQCRSFAWLMVQELRLIKQQRRPRQDGPQSDDAHQKHLRAGQSLYALAKTNFAASMDALTSREQLCLQLSRRLQCHNPSWSLALFGSSVIPGFCSPVGSDVDMCLLLLQRDDDARSTVLTPVPNDSDAGSKVLNEAQKYLGAYFGASAVQFRDKAVVPVVKISRRVVKELTPKVPGSVDMDMVTQTDGILKARLLRRYLVRSPELYPVLHGLIYWARSANLIGHKPDGHMNASGLIWCLIDHCHKHFGIVPIDPASVYGWDPVDRCDIPAPASSSSPPLPQQTTDRTTPATWWSQFIVDLPKHSEDRIARAGHIALAFVEWFSKIHQSHEDIVVSDAFNPAQTAFEVLLVSKGEDKAKAKAISLQAQVLLHALSFFQQRFNRAISTGRKRSMHVMLPLPRSSFDRWLTPKATSEYFSAVLHHDARLPDNAVAFIPHVPSGGFKEMTTLARLPIELKGKGSDVEKIAQSLSKLRSQLNMHNVKTRMVPYVEDASLLLFEGAESDEDSVGFYPYVNPFHHDAHKGHNLHTPNLLDGSGGEAWHAHARHKLLQAIIRQLGELDSVPPSLKALKNLRRSVCIRFGWYYLINLPRSFDVTSIRNVNVAALEAALMDGRRSYRDWMEKKSRQASQQEQQQQQQQQNTASFSSASSPSTRTRSNSDEDDEDDVESNASSEPVGPSKRPPPPKQSSRSTPTSGVSSSLFTSIPEHSLQRLRQLLGDLEFEWANDKGHVEDAVPTGYGVTIKMGSKATDEEAYVRLGTDLQFKHQVSTRPLRWLAATLCRQQLEDQKSARIQSDSRKTDARLYVETSSDLPEKDQPKEVIVWTDDKRSSFLRSPLFPALWHIERIREFHREEYEFKATTQSGWRSINWIAKLNRVRTYKAPLLTQGVFECDNAALYELELEACLPESHCVQFTDAIGDGLLNLAYRLSQVMDPDRNQ